VFPSAPDGQAAFPTPDGGLDSGHEHGCSGATPLRAQHRDSLEFARGEGIWYDAGRVYLATTTDETIHVYDTSTATVSVLYRAGDTPGTPLSRNGRRRTVTLATATRTSGRGHTTLRIRPSKAQARLLRARRQP
jgi:hypothetical protein